MIAITTHPLHKCQMEEMELSEINVKERFTIKRVLVSRIGKSPTRYLLILK